MNRRALASAALLMLSVVTMSKGAGAADFANIIISNKTAGPVKYYRDKESICQIEPGKSGSDCEADAARIPLLWPTGFRFVLADGTEYQAFGIPSSVCIEETGLTDCQGSPLPSSGGYADWYAGKDAQQFSERDEAFRLYTKAIESGDLSPRDQAVALTNRGRLHLAKDDFDNAIADYSETIRLAPDIADAYFYRAYAQFRKGAPDQAFADYSEAIRVEPAHSAAYSERGNLYLRKGELDHAIADYTESIRLGPDDELDYFGRGVARFASADYAAATGDFGQYVTFGSFGFKYANAVLWRFLSRARAGAPDDQELQRFAAEFDAKQWPGPVVDFFLGRITADELRAAAAKGDSEYLAQQACEADFYIGEYELSRNNGKAARQLLQRVAETCPPTYHEHERITAVAELKRLDQ